MVNKRDLPQKICPTCNRPFFWRKKWRLSWNTVVYCGEKCRRNKKNERCNSLV
ncbi:DUF2256 domain-containing protein [Acidiluteibacter ferrifornacis]|uniref:DUF2256 domain-containing protein n=1 Tax=Acidiluteibacter ferrifornacis TaxID=2692424 RepID=A0A6N9NIF9_9FLAO|nr:DUF2256 domain-containing protein [Acidiluteibacter ferrifornacis]MBR9830962.1 DUF2256 domain-containing protein [bacterium]NBG64987.1 DUF2256 domain-containing protein [Acidiluteibacter ferrifornacis]